MGVLAETEIVPNAIESLQGMTIGLAGAIEDKQDAKPSRTSAAKVAGKPAPSRIVADDGRSFGVREALGATPSPPSVEVYVGWAGRGIGVATRRGRTGAIDWSTAGPILRQRVLDMVDPLCVAGWSLDGTFANATRWDMSRSAGGDVYEGCWVRLRR